MTTGIFNTDMLTTDLAKKSFAGMITRLMPNGSAPLFGISSMLENDTAVAVEHGFFTKTMVFPEMTLSALVADGVATTFTVVSTANILPGMLMQVDTTLENIIVDTIISATQFTCTRGVGTVTAVAIANGVTLFQIGTAFEESSARPNPLNIIPVRITNLTQIFRNTWANSESARATQVIAGDSNVAESKQDASAFHAVDIEKSVIFGQKSQGTRNGNPFRTMDGLINLTSDLSHYPPSYSVPNVTTLAATTNWTQLQAALDPVFDQATDPKGGNERVMFVGGTALLVINEIARLNGQYELVDGQTSFGLQFRTLKTARGTFRLIEHSLFNSNSTWNTMGLVVDLNTFRLAYLGNRKTQHRGFNSPSNDVASDNGIDAVGGTLTTEVTTVIKNPPANAVLYGFTAAAVG